jgi:hypothetical protein
MKTTSGGFSLMSPENQASVGRSPLKPKPGLSGPTFDFSVARRLLG